MNAAGENIREDCDGIWTLAIKMEGILFSWVQSFVYWDVDNGISNTSTVLAVHRHLLFNSYGII